MTPDAGLRLLAVIPGPSTGVQMVFARRQVASLRRLGVAVEEFYLDSRSDFKRTSGLFLSLARRIRRWRPDLVHAHYGSGTAALTVLASPAPVVITFRGSDLHFRNLSRFKRALAPALSRFAARRAAGVVCVSRELGSMLPRCRAKVTVLATGVDTEAFRPIDRQQARRQLGWSLSERVVVFNAGLLQAVKRPDLAQAAFAQAEQSLGNLRLHVLDGTTLPETIPLVFNAADCLLLCSDTEGSPTVIQEALACNLPVVSVDVGDVREVLAGVSPTMIVERDPASIANGITQILSTPVRSNGAQKAEQYSTHTIALRLVEFFRSILAAEAHGNRRAQLRNAQDVRWC
jgi:teichuronic acid biosynthesis glycosyltransferase TuaC